MNTHRIAKWVMIGILALMAALTAIAITNPAYASDDDELVIDWTNLGCMTVVVHHDGPHNASVDVVSLDATAGGDVVGHYVWLQHAWNAPDSYRGNNVSWDLTEYEDGETTIPLCMPYVVSGFIPTGAGSAYKVKGAAPEAPDVPLVSIVTTSAIPHPSMADAWITGNGWVIL